MTSCYIMSDISDRYLLLFYNYILSISGWQFLYGKPLEHTLSDVKYTAQTWHVQTITFFFFFFTSIWSEQALKKPFKIRPEQGAVSDTFAQDYGVNLICKRIPNGCLAAVCVIESESERERDGARWRVSGHVSFSSGRHRRTTCRRHLGTIASTRPTSSSTSLGKRTSIL